MADSIEKIWKDGFLREDALIIPKLNNLYTKKSIHIVDKWMRVIKLENAASIPLGVLLLIGFSIFGLPTVGSFLLLFIIGMFIHGRKYMRSLKKVDNNQSTYQYLIAFDQWLKELIKDNKKFMYYVFPLVVLCIYGLLWFSDVRERFIVPYIINKKELHLFWIIYLILLPFIGGPIYKLVLKIMFGRMLSKLEEIIADVEELRK